MTAFALPSDFLNYFDRRTVGELLDDDGTPVVDIASSPILQEFLLAASGQIGAACEVSGLYSVVGPDDDRGIHRSFGGLAAAADLYPGGRDARAAALRQAFQRLLGGAGEVVRGVPRKAPHRAATVFVRRRATW